MSFGIYAIGFAILISGLIYAAYLLHIPAYRVEATRQRDLVG